jgi:O-antigen ligase
MNELSQFSWNLFLWQMLILATIILWFYCLSNVAKNKFKANDKIIWLLVVIFVPFVGSILYLIIGKKTQIKG